MNGSNRAKTRRPFPSKRTKQGDFGVFGPQEMHNLVKQLASCFRLMVLLDVTTGFVEATARAEAEP